ncbi:MAG: histone H1 [Bacteroidales bacterium]|nr:histone H1 [Bacteroidales bacterium]MDY6001822.1 histone H1 [Candidatus Cryptobacteroides sp.]
MKKLVARIKEEIDSFVVNADAQLEKGNKAAGARARKAALALMKDLKDFRKESVAAAKKAAPKKK